MRANRKKQPELYGVEPIGMSRYLALYMSQVGWILLGLYLLANAYWPSTCRPHDVLEIYGCSARLHESRRWIEASLTTWLWSTPFLIVLEVMRRFKRQERR